MVAVVFAECRGALVLGGGWHAEGVEHRDQRGLGDSCMAGRSSRRTRLPRRSGCASSTSEPGRSVMPPILARVSHCSLACRRDQSTSRINKSSQVSRRTTSRASPVAGEDDRYPAGAVVLVGHRVAVGAGDRHREQVADRRVAQRATPSMSWSPDSQCLPTTLTSSPPPTRFDDRRLEPLPGQRHLEVVAHPAVDRDVGRPVRRA